MSGAVAAAVWSELTCWEYVVPLTMVLTGVSVCGDTVSGRVSEYVLTLSAVSEHDATLGAVRSCVSFRLLYVRRLFEVLLRS